jgi:hypothetical protein
VLSGLDTLPDCMSLISYKINEQNEISTDNDLKGTSEPETDRT